ncbi:MAG: PAS domain-containing protein, partial [Planctomycetes bacterium]|nr:PAS domain-containing protein [Planctomycetota bacterium]
MTDKGGIRVANGDLPVGDLQETLRLGGIGLWELEVNRDDIGASNLVLSPSYLDVIGSTDENLPTTYREFYTTFIHAEYWERIWDNFRDLVDGRVTVYRREYRIWNQKLREWRWVRSFASAVPPAEGERVKKISGAIQDIHDHRLLEEARAADTRDREKLLQKLQLEREKLSVVIDAADIGWWLW